MFMGAGYCIMRYYGSRAQKAQTARWNALLSLTPTEEREFDAAADRLYRGMLYRNAEGILCMKTPKVRS